MGAERQAEIGELLRLAMHIMEVREAEAGEPESADGITSAMELADCVIRSRKCIAEGMVAGPERRRLEDDLEEFEQRFGPRASPKLNELRRLTMALAPEVFKMDRDWQEKLLGRPLTEAELDDVMRGARSKARHVARVKQTLTDAPPSAE